MDRADNQSSKNTSSIQGKSYKAVLLGSQSDTNEASPPLNANSNSQHYGSGGGGGGTESTKPLHPSFNLKDKELIVINNDDILESTKQESEVIVVHEPMEHGTDLQKLLGSNWPKSAGDAVTSLNRTAQTQSEACGGGATVAHNGFNIGFAAGGSLSSHQPKKNRNKTANPMSHIGMSRSTGRRQLEEPSSSSRSATNRGYSNNSKENQSENNEEDRCNSPIYDNLIDLDGQIDRNDELEKLVSTRFNIENGSPLQEVPLTRLGVGSMVEVSMPGDSGDMHGVIRWIGKPPGCNEVMVGVELEDDVSNKQINSLQGHGNEIRLVKNQQGCNVFVLPNRCSNDRRFIENGADKPSTSHQSQIDQSSKKFGGVDCPIVAGAVAPIKISNLKELEDVCGKFKGIQGHHNSCYLDATLFSMFTFTSVFDSLLFRPPEPDDIPHYLEVQKVLREEIVNPLRKNVFVRADRVMKLRQLLDKLSSISGLTTEEKDPEEFMNSLLAQILHAEPFLKLNSGQDAYFYQLFVEKDEHLSFPTVQQLFEQSFYSSNIKLKEKPSCLIIQMPRFGKSYKMYSRILPSQVLDVTDIIEDSPRTCSVCGKLAEFECRDCFGSLQTGVGLECTAFCPECLQTVHSHVKRVNHKQTKLSIPNDFRMMAEQTMVPRLYMELFAVVCIETSHYVTFVKAGSGPDSPWCFFDSMADRKGEQNGYNIPEIISIPELPQWLSEEGARAVNEASSNDKLLPEHAKRLFCDAYMCMYQSTDVMMYR